ncbi:hypothetical protein BDV36DRAFT_251741 [Aspergillus pseudocaelatus]|uniref:Uncharacterized protein n=1 Tax=Aspergillus pseudocaelatus TaxID=1825620 RepID=A0ABQ6WQ93_9EURO|nr:hypothetical protein BDV36DRAFT_251741 [Aspergillus pseudocaelatus]
MQLFLDPALAISLVELEVGIASVAFAILGDSIPSESNEYVSVSDFQELLPKHRYRTITGSHDCSLSRLVERFLVVRDTKYPRSKVSESGP